MKKGEILKVKNTKRRRNSNEFYNALHCEQNELPVNLLLTENQIAEAVKRAGDQPEDIPSVTTPSFFQRLFNK